jgi:hypothetical protein
MLQALHPLQHTVTGFQHDGIFARLDALHIDTNVARRETKFIAASGHMDGTGAGNQCFGGYAAHIHAGATPMAALNDGRAQTLFGAARSHGGPGLPRANNQGVKRFSRHKAPPAGM